MDRCFSSVLAALDSPTTFWGNATDYLHQVRCIVKQPGVPVVTKALLILAMKCTLPHLIHVNAQAVGWRRICRDFVSWLPIEEYEVVDVDALVEVCRATSHCDLATLTRTMRKHLLDKRMSPTQRDMHAAILESTFRHKRFLMLHHNTCKWQDTRVYGGTLIASSCVSAATSGVASVLGMAGASASLAMILRIHSAPSLLTESEIMEADHIIADATGFGTVHI